MAERYTVEVPGFEGRPPIVEVSTWVRSRIFLDGAEAPGGALKGQVELRRNDGQHVPARLFVEPNFIDPLPKLVVDGVPYDLAPRYRWYEYVWLGLPLVMALQGGLIGALVGVVTASVNSRIFRSRRGPSRYVITGLVSILGLVVMLVVSVFAVALIRSTFG